MERGDKITITATIDAFHYGYRSKMVRVNINNTLVWVPLEMTDIEEQENEDGIFDYIVEELVKRCINGSNKPIDNDLQTAV